MIVEGSGPTTSYYAAAPRRHRRLLSTRHRHPQVLENGRGKLHGGGSLNKG